MHFLKANTAVDVLIGPFVDDTDGKTAETSLTLAQADIKLSKNGQALAQKNDATAASHDANGYYNCELDATDTNTEGNLVLIIHESGALPVRHEYNVLAEAAYDSLFVAKDSGYMDVNMKAVSEDTTAADNCEAFFDGTGYAGTNNVIPTVTTVTGGATAAELAKVPKSDGTTTWNDTALASIQSEANDALVAQKLDHLVAVADADDVVDNSIIAKLTSKSGTADWSSYDNTTDSLEAIADKIVAASPQTHLAGSSNDTTGTIDSGTYADTQTINTTYWQISPAGAAVGGFGLNVDLVFTVGTGLNRTPESVNITGYFDSSPVRDVDIWAYNYILAAWDQISNAANNMQNASSNQNYQYSLNQNHIQTSDGEVKIRFTSTSITITDDLYIDYCGIGSVAVEASGLTADAIQQAVWARADSGHDEDTLGYNVSKLHLVHGDIVSATDATRFVIDYDIPTNDIYNGMVITVEDKTDDHYESRRIVDTIAASDEVIVDRAFGFTPVADDDYYIMNAAYADVNTTHVSGTAQTANDIGADTNTILDDTNELQTNQGNWLTATSVDLNADAITASVYDETTAFPITSADTGATQIARTGADADTLETLSDEIASIQTDTTAIISDIAGLNDIAAADIWDVASAVTTDFGTLLERLYQWFNNKETIVDGTGAATLRNIGDSADLATWSITDNDTTTTRTEITWA